MPVTIIAVDNGLAEDRHVLLPYSSIAPHPNVLL